MSNRFYRPPRADQIPFNNSTNGYLSDDVQAAIEESKSEAVANDRFAVTYSYNGNCGSGKYPEFYSGQSSDISPFLLPNDSIIKTITLRTTLASTGVMSIYEASDLLTPLVSVTFTNETNKIVSPDISLDAYDEVVIKCDSGSFSKPHGALWIQTSITG